MTVNLETQENPSMIKLTQTIKEFSKVGGNKINVQSQQSFHF